MKLLKYSVLVWSIVHLSSSLGAAQAVDKKAMAQQVRAEFKHAWDGYKQYCWGHDDLKPISKTCRDWYGTPILMTPVDSLDSLYLLGFKDEADKTRDYIVKNLSFDKDISVQNFEITIAASPPCPRTPPREGRTAPVRHARASASRTRT